MAIEITRPLWLRIRHWGEIALALSATLVKRSHGPRLMLVCAAIMSTTPSWAKTSRTAAIALTITTGLLTGAVILVVAFFFGAGLRCND